MWSNLRGRAAVECEERGGGPMSKDSVVEVPVEESQAASEASQYC